MTIPHIKITQAHYDAAVDFLFAPKMNKLDIINKAVEIALAEAHAQSESVVSLAWTGSRDDVINLLKALGLV